MAKEEKEAFDADHFSDIVGDFVKDYFDEYYHDGPGGVRGKEGEAISFNEGDILEYLEKETRFFKESKVPKTDEELDDAFRWIDHYMGVELWDRVDDEIEQTDPTVLESPMKKTNKMEEEEMAHSAKVKKGVREGQFDPEIWEEANEVAERLNRKLEDLFAKSQSDDKDFGEWMWDEHEELSSTLTELEAVVYGDPDDPSKGHFRPDKLDTNEDLKGITNEAREAMGRVFIAEQHIRQYKPDASPIRPDAKVISVNPTISEYETQATFKIDAQEYKEKYDPTSVGRNMLGTWYEHPLYGDEAGLLLEHDGRMHKTFEEDVPSDEELGFPHFNPVVKVRDRLSSPRFYEGGVRQSSSDSEPLSSPGRPDEDLEREIRNVREAQAFIPEHGKTAYFLAKGNLFSAPVENEFVQVEKAQEIALTHPDMDEDTKAFLISAANERAATYTVYKELDALTDGLAAFDPEVRDQESGDTDWDKFEEKYPELYRSFLSSDWVDDETYRVRQFDLESEYMVDENVPKDWQRHFADFHFEFTDTLATVAEGEEKLAALQKRDEELRGMTEVPDTATDVDILESPSRRKKMTRKEWMAEGEKEGERFKKIEKRLDLGPGGMVWRGQPEAYTKSVERYEVKQPDGTIEMLSVEHNKLVHPRKNKFRRMQHGVAVVPASTSLVDSKTGKPAKPLKEYWTVNQSFSGGPLAEGDALGGFFTGGMWNHFTKKSIADVKKDIKKKGFKQQTLSESGGTTIRDSGGSGTLKSPIKVDRHGFEEGCWRCGVDAPLAERTRDPGVADTAYKCKKCAKELTEKLEKSRDQYYKASGRSEGRTLKSPASGSGQMEFSRKTFETYDQLKKYMKDEAKKRGTGLASGVGNDMSYAFYVRESSDEVHFRPDGIGGKFEKLFIKSEAPPELASPASRSRRIKTPPLPKGKAPKKSKATPMAKATRRGSVKSYKDTSTGRTFSRRGKGGMPKSKRFTRV